MPSFLITKTHTPSNLPYAGPLCAVVGILPSTVYPSRRAAARDCAKLNRLSPGSFTTAPQRDQAAWESEQRAANGATMDALRWEWLIHGNTLTTEGQAAYARAVAGVPAPVAIAA